MPFRGQGQVFFAGGGRRTRAGASGPGPCPCWPRRRDSRAVPAWAACSFFIRKSVRSAIGTASWPDAPDPSRRLRRPSGRSLARRMPPIVTGRRARIRASLWPGAPSARRFPQSRERFPRILKKIGRAAPAGLGSREKKRYRSPLVSS